MNETISLVVATIVEHAAYPFQVDNKIRDLVSATRDLAAMKEDVKTSIINSEREDGDPTKQVEEWLNKVDSTEKESLEIHKNYHKRRRSIWSDYTIGRSVVKKIHQMKNLCEERETIGLTIHVPPPLAQEIPASSSKSSNLESVLQHIRDDMYNIIGIYGMGGVGKTHLLKQINNEIYKYSTFGMVIFVTCSKDCSEEKIQNEIIDKLGLNKSDNMERKRYTIFNFLKKRSFALLLDDLWSRVDLETVGIPIQLDPTCKRKVVLTTRSIRVCGLMEVTKKIKVNVLNWDGAWNLFKEKVTEETIVSHPLIQKYAVQVVKELGGLPLALITVGRAMYHRTDPSEWELAIELLKQARLNDVELSDRDENVFKVLKFSYDKLRNDKLRECFLHCSLWPEDYEIEKDELVELWMGLGLIDEPDINMTYSVGYNYIRELQAVCLLEVTSKDSQIKLHDVIRDMSLWIISGQGVERNKWIVRSGASENDKGINIQTETEKIVLMFQSNFFFSYDTGGNIKLTTLLFTRSSLNDVKGLRHLSFSKLTVLNLQRNRFQVFPLEVCNLISLRFIDLSYNEIHSLPNELGALLNLKYLFLKENSIHSISIGTISKMKALYVLCLTLRRGFYKKEIRSKLDFVMSLLQELQSLPSFGALGIEVVDMMQFQKLCELSNVPVRWLTVTMWEELSTFCFSGWFLENSQSRNNIFSLSIENMSVESLKFESTTKNPSICQFGRLEDLQIWHSGMKEIVWKGLEPKDVLPRLKCLKFWACHSLTSISWVVHLPCLQQLHVSHCRGIKQLIIGNEVSDPNFPFLKQLILGRLDELEIICEPEITFPALESLIIEKCKKLKNLPFRTDNVPIKLKCIQAEEKWWNNIEWDESNLKTSLSGYVRFTG
jgi:Leucine-rich repeat (LRR) protein